MLYERVTTGRTAATAAIIGLAIAGLTACGADGTERARGDDADATERVEGVATASSTDRPGSGDIMPVSAVRPGGDPATEPAPEPADPAPPANVSYEDAESVFRSGEYAEAAELFEVYTDRRPDNPWGHYMLGLSARRAGDHERAEAALKRTVELDSSNVKGLVNLARVLLDREEPAEALEHVERAVDLTPQSGAGWRVLGNVLSDLGRTDRAIEAYREALVVDSEDAWSMNNLALVMIRDGRYDEALPPLARAATLRPDVATFQNNLGIALERGGHPGDAADAFRAALQADDEYEKARVSLERVEARTPDTVTEPFDPAELANAFADEVETWTPAGERDEQLEPVDTAGGELDEHPEPVDTAGAEPTPDSMDTGTVKGDPDPNG